MAAAVHLQSILARPIQADDFRGFSLPSLAAAAGTEDAARASCGRTCGRRPGSEATAGPAGAAAATGTAAGGPQADSAGPASTGEAKLRSCSGSRSVAFCRRVPGPLNFRAA